MEKEEVFLSISLKRKLFTTFVGLEVASFPAHFRLCQNNCNKLCQEEGFPAFSSSPTAGSSIRPLHPQPPTPLPPSHPTSPWRDLDWWQSSWTRVSEQNWWTFTEIHVIWDVFHNYPYLSNILQEQSIIQRINLSLISVNLSHWNLNCSHNAATRKIY